MQRIIISNARVLTLAAQAAQEAPRRGAAMRELGLIERGFVVVEEGRIAEVGEGQPENPGNHAVIDAGGRIVMPAFVDCHTHACWAGNRFDEFQMKLGGASYLEILNAGGGIMSTVRSVRAASQKELTDLLLRRLHRMATLGSATIEVKSGYGLTTDDELKMLRAISSAARQAPMTIVPTFLGAHAIDRDQPQFVERTINETLPVVAQEFPGITCDAFCEQGSWSLADTRRLFENAVDLGCRLRVHSDQFNSLGMTRLAIEMGAVSVDHLEMVNPKDLEHLARSRTIGVMMPATGFHLDDRYAPGREMIDAGGALAIATNCNPGSSPTPSMPFVIALACRKLRLSPAEAIVASTINAAHVLGLDDEVGTIEPGKRADLQMLEYEDERELGYEIAPPPPVTLLINGRAYEPQRPA